jgi:hypothetical protein
MVMLVCAVGLAIGVAGAQTQSQKPPAGGAPAAAPQSGTSAPSTQSQAPGQAPGQQGTAGAQPSQQPGTTGGQQAQAPAAPQGKHYPQAHAQDEFEAFRQAVSAPDPATTEKAADDFAAKFPNSELRVLLYQKAMQMYYQQNQPDKVVDSGRKVLMLDPDNTLALSFVATAIAERTRESDLDRDQRLDEASKMAHHAIDSVDTEMPALAPPSVTPEQLQGIKGTLLSMDYGTLGNIELQRKDYKQAEADLRKAIEFGAGSPDALAYYRLALALDHQGRYQDALAQAQKAVDLNQGDVSSVVAKQERDRLQKLAGGATGTTPPAAPSGQSNLTPSGTPAQPQTSNPPKAGTTPHR